MSYLFFHKSHKFLLSSLYHSFTNSVSSPPMLSLQVTSQDTSLSHKISFKDNHYSLKCPLSPLSLLQTHKIHFTSVFLHHRWCFYILYFKKCIMLHLQLSVCIYISQQTVFNCHHCTLVSHNSRLLRGAKNCWFKSIV